MQPNTSVPASSARTLLVFHRHYKSICPVPESPQRSPDSAPGPASPEADNQTPAPPPDSPQTATQTATPPRTGSPAFPTQSSTPPYAPPTTKARPPLPRSAPATQLVPPTW